VAAIALARLRRADSTRRAVPSAKNRTGPWLDFNAKVAKDYAKVAKVVCEKAGRREVEGISLARLRRADSIEPFSPGRMERSMSSRLRVFA
jgi:hypothetical protein